jgi:hypothetical protein
LRCSSRCGGGSYAALRASIGSGGVLTGCVSKRTGSLRVVATHRRCRKGEIAVRWNEKGSAGPKGATGPAGVTGAAGVAGLAGAAGSTGAAGPPGPGTGKAGGDLAGSFPDPTVTSIGGKTPITAATTIGGALTGSLPDPSLAAGAVQVGDFAVNTAYCSIDSVTSLLPSVISKCSNGGSVTSSHPVSGTYCLDLPIEPGAGASRSMPRARASRSRSCRPTRRRSRMTAPA